MSQSLLALCFSQKQKEGYIQLIISLKKTKKKGCIKLLGHLSRDPDAAAPVGNPGREVVDGGSLVSSGQPTLVVLAWREPS